MKRRSTKAQAAHAVYTKWRPGYLDGAVCDRCAKRPATDVHHRRFRSAGGHLTNPTNCARLCHPCHEWVHANPRAAHDAGWIVRAGDPDWDACGASPPDGVRGVTTVRETGVALDAEPVGPGEAAVVPAAGRGVPGPAGTVAEGPSC